MLVLSRRLGEAILIADNIRVTVTSIRGGNVRLGIEAPPSVEVDREEVARRRGAGADNSPAGSGPAAEHVQVLNLMDALLAEQKPAAETPPPKKLASSGRGEAAVKKRKSS